MTPHLRQVVLAVTSVLALAVVCAVAWTPRPEVAARSPEESRHAGAPAPASVAPPPPPAVSARNVFEFADRVPAPAIDPLPLVAIPPPLAPALRPVPTVSPVRLVGFVRRGGVLRAALSVNGLLAVLAPGEESDGYVVLAIDEDAGVTVRAPDGAEQVLAPPAS